MSEHYKSGTIIKPHGLRLQKLQNQRERCCYESRHNLWELALFLFVSICAYNIRDINLFAVASEPLRQVLGYPPPAYLVSAALAVYFFSAVVLGLTALMNRAKPSQTWNHLGYRSIYYFFYSFTGSIGGYFVPVLVAGLVLYGLDQCQLRLYARQMIDNSRIKLDEL